MQQAATSAFNGVVPSTVSSSSGRHVQLNCCMIYTIAQLTYIAITTTDYYFKPTSTPSTDGKNDDSGKP